LAAVAAAVSWTGAWGLLGAGELTVHFLVGCAQKHHKKPAVGIFDHGSWIIVIKPMMQHIQQIKGKLYLFYFIAK
jgi:hypothetical protein